MLERDLQNYLFDNPQVLFPNQQVLRRERELYIAGRRIDLLFDVGHASYIVELKRKTIGRADVGQVLEYYGLMRQSDKTSNLRMMLVSPSIPEFRRIALEEFGIRCMEVQFPTRTSVEELNLATEVRKSEKRQRADLLLDSDPLQLNWNDFVPPVSKHSFLLARHMVGSGLSSIGKNFSDYEVLPVAIKTSRHQDVLCFPETESLEKCMGVGTWWAYSFGHLEEMPKNDVPNISVNALPWGLDVAINAELKTSQRVMLDRISQSPEDFNELVSHHGDLRFQAWLKLSHQPRIYHWIPLLLRDAGAWGAEDVLNTYSQSEKDFELLRAKWLVWIRENNSELSEKQLNLLEGKNSNLNLALRLVDTKHYNSDFWQSSFEGQTRQLESDYLKLKPFIEFFV